MNTRKQTNKRKCVCFALKACADKQKYVYPRAYAHKQRKLCMLRSKNPCRQAKVCIAWSLRWIRKTHKGNCVCPVLKARADKRKYGYPRACADKQRKVCMLRSKNPFREAKVCIPQSLRWQTHKGKCVCLVLKTCAYKRKHEYIPQSLRRQPKESVYASFYKPVPMNKYINKYINSFTGNANFRMNQT